MSQYSKILTSRTKIRFQDCDPFNHLNNAAYINYFNNAREDQLITDYGIDIYKMAREEGKSWVVGSNQIAYLRPAVLMEEVIIESQLLEFNDSILKVELRMLNEDRSEIKAIMWSNYVYFNLIQQKREQYSEELLTLFNEVVNPVGESTFEDRMLSLKKIKV